MGIRKLSMSASQVAAVKMTLSALTAVEAERIAKTACALSTAAEVRQYLEDENKLLHSKIIRG
jgi:phosphoenolpyruvate-protein kinase (PTS system EI component)